MLTRKQTALLTLLLSLIFCTPLVQASQATSYVAGVKAGDTADYTVTKTGTGTPYPVNFSSGTMHLEVQTVSLTVVTIGLSGTSIPGSVVPGEPNKVVSFTEDVSSSAVLNLWFFVVAANLSATDPVYFGAPWQISATASVNVAGQSRTVNKMSFFFSYPNLNISMSYEWDKTTGILVGMNESCTFEGESNLSIAMTSTSLWSGLPFGLTPIALLVIVIAVVGIVGTLVYLKRRK